MKPFIFSSLSALLVLTLVIPARAQTPGRNEVDAPNPGASESNQNSPGGGSNRPGMNRPNSASENNRPGMAGETDQGVPGVTNQSTPGDPDRGGTNGQGTPAFPNQSVPGDSRSTPHNQPGSRIPEANPNMEQGVPGRMNQTTPTTPYGSGTTNPGRTTVPNQTPSSTNPSSSGALTPPSQGTIPRATNYQPTPFQLVNLARNGYLQSAGIPQGSNLVTSYIKVKYQRRIWCGVPSV